MSDEVIQIIDFEKRLSSMEHLVLFYYSRLKTGKKENYKNFNITEDIIQNYNDETSELKKQVSLAIKPYYDRFNAYFERERWNYEKPVLWSDREKTEYYINQLKDSHRFEIYVEEMFRQRGVDIGLYYGRDQQYSGETVVGIEIKLDKMLKKTGNVYIEYQERMRKSNQWVNSGILKEDNTKYIFIGDVDRSYIFRKQRLLSYYERLVKHGEYIAGTRLVWEKKHGTSKGFVLNSQIGQKESISIDKVIEEIKNG